MKRIAYFTFLTALLSSCSSRSELKGNRVLVQFRDTIPHEYYLLSVRDSGLLVKPGYYDLPGAPLVVPFSKITRVMHTVNGKSTGALIGGLTGAIVGMGTVWMKAKNEPPGQIGGGEGVAIESIIVGAPAMILGSIIGYNLSEDEKGYSVTSAHDRDALRDYSQYPDKEPPELQKIK